ncbi:MAG: glycosyltransferase family 1 protein [Rhodothermales bacterium]|nr:glycosyltransferase family 1 protein [Rhodothermales bacterium]
MRVLINAASAHMGGSVTYLRNVLRWAPQLAPDDEFIAYVPAKTRAKLAGAGVDPRVTLEPYPYADTSGPSRLYFDQVRIPRLLGEHRADVLFSSTGFGTFFSPRPQVLLIRNLAYFDPAFQAKYRELGRSLKKNTARRWHSLLSIRQADLVLFPTRAMQALVAHYIDLEGKWTESIHYGFDHAAFTQAGSETAALAGDLCRWKADGYRLLLNVSTFAVQKNVETLVEALPHLKAQGVRAKLVTTLSRDVTTDRAEYDALMRRVEALGLREDVVTLGYVPYRQLGALYQAADLYVFPSFTESFGHSMVEAMAAGLPVVAADTAVNREVCGTAGRFFRTFDPLDCARTLASVLQDGAARARQAERAAARARHFSWERYAEQLIALFREAARA